MTFGNPMTKNHLTLSSLFNSQKMQTKCKLGSAYSNLIMFQSIWRTKRCYSLLLTDSLQKTMEFTLSDSYLDLVYLCSYQRSSPSSGKHSMTLSERISWCMGKKVSGWCLIKGPTKLKNDVWYKLLFILIW